MKAVLTLITLAALATALAPPLAAQTPDPLLDLIPDDRVKIEINLQGALLRMVAAATREEDPGFSSLVAGIRSIRVRIAELDDAGAAATGERIARVAAEMRSEGWQSVVRVRDDGEQVHILLREIEGVIHGVVALFAEADGDAGVVQIDGEIDPEELGRLARGLNLGDLGEALGEATNPTPERRGNGGEAP